MIVSRCASSFDVDLAAGASGTLSSDWLSKVVTTDLERCGTGVDSVDKVVEPGVVRRAAGLFTSVVDDNSSSVLGADPGIWECDTGAGLVVDKPLETVLERS